MLHGARAADDLINELPPCGRKFPVAFDRGHEWILDHRFIAPWRIAERLAAIVIGWGFLGIAWSWPDVML